MANDTEDKKHFPTKEEIIEFIDMSPTPVGKREIARAFNIKGAAKIELKKILKELKIGGDVVKGGRRRFDKPDRLPPVEVLEITGVDDDGEVQAKPNVWKHDYDPPLIVVKSIRRGGPSAPGIGDKNSGQTALYWQTYLRSQHHARPRQRPTARLGPLSPQ